MPLAEMQGALASLYTSESERERLERDPAAFARTHGLGDAELAEIRSLGARRLHAYADTLDRKRASEAVAFLPISSAALGPAFRAAFLAHARRTPLPATRHRYRDDALAYAGDVRRRGASPRATLSEELALFEAETFWVFTRRVPLAWRRFRYPVLEAVRDANAPIVERATLVIWSGFPLRTVRAFGSP